MSSVSTLAVVSVLALVSTLTPPDTSSPASEYSDLGGAGAHRPAIEALAQAGILAGAGCEPGRFCPDRPLSRWVMAVWIVRALGEEEPPAGDHNSFADVDSGEWWAGYVRRLAVLGVTRGCATDPARFCPDSPVTRAQMASFLTRAFDLAASSGAGPSGAIRFADVEGNPHAPDIHALADSNISVGCASDPLRYCPDRPVTRAEMATFLARALGLAPVAEHVADPDGRRLLHLVSRYTTHYPCCAPRVRNIQLIADQVDGAVVGPWQRFSVNRRVGRRTVEKGYVEAGTLVNGELVDTVGGGVSQFATTLYNAVFWGGYRDVAHQPHSRYFSRYPEGVEATLDWPRVDLIFRNDTSRNLIIRSEYTDTSLTVKLFGDNDGRAVAGEWRNGEGRLEVLAEGGDRARVVSAHFSERTDVTPPPPPEFRSDPQLPVDTFNYLQPAADGWAMEITRTIERQGRSAVQRWSVRYAPLRAIIEVHPCFLAGACPNRSH